MQNLKISSDAFKDTQLTFIYLERCGLEEFPDVSPIGSLLKTLKLPWNLLSSIPYNIISKLTSLQYLDMTGNRLTEIPDVSTFAGSLQGLALSHNRIRTGYLREVP